MKNITINAKNHTIEMTKTFAAAASKFGSSEYRDLLEARRDYPSFKVIIVAKKTARPKYKGLTYEYMENYIATHDNDAKSIMSQFMEKRALTDEARAALAVSASYKEIKEWFFETYPNVAKFHQTRTQLVVANNA